MYIAIYTKYSSFTF